MKYVINIFLVLYTINLSAQLKTYNGNFKLDNEDRGKAIYTYYENPETLEWTKQGKFEYKLILNEPKNAGSYNFIITGNYNKGLKEGLWTYTIKQTNFITELRVESSSIYFSNTGNITLKANYKNGLPNGNWNYTNDVKSRKVSSVFGKLNYGPWGQESYYNLNCNFNNGKYVGSFLINAIDYTENGQFNETGNKEGVWTTTTKTSEKIYSFLNGKLIKSVERILPNGEVDVNNTISEIELNYLNDFIAGKTDNNELYKVGYVVTKSDGLINYFFSNTVNDINLIQYKVIGGDKSITYKDNSFLLNRPSGVVYIISPIKFVQLNDYYVYKDAEQAFENKKYSVALSKYEALLSESKEKIRDSQLKISDIEIINQKIILTKSKIEEENNEQLIKDHDRTIQNIYTSKETSKFPFFILDSIFDNNNKEYITNIVRKEMGLMLSDSAIDNNKNSIKYTFIPIDANLENYNIVLNISFINKNINELLFMYSPKYVKNYNYTDGWFKTNIGTDSLWKQRSLLESDNSIIGYFRKKIYNDKFINRDVVYLNNKMEKINENTIKIKFNNGIDTDEFLRNKIKKEYTRIEEFTTNKYLIDLIENNGFIVKINK